MSQCEGEGKTLNLEASRNELSIKGKNGLGFLISGSVIWMIITVIYFLPIGIYGKSILMLCSSGIMFPLSIGINHLLKADWKLEGHPLGPLGLFLNLAQVMYFPILIWAIGKSPEEAVIFFAIITGAHFFPYGWFYNTKAYAIMAPVSACAVMLIGWKIAIGNLWLVPLSMVILLLILVVWLFMDYQNKKRDEEKAV